MSTSESMDIIEISDHSDSSCYDIEEESTELFMEDVRGEKEIGSTCMRSVEI